MGSKLFTFTTYNINKSSRNKGQLLTFLLNLLYELTGLSEVGMHTTVSFSLGNLSPEVKVYEYNIRYLGAISEPLIPQCAARGSLPVRRYFMLARDSISCTTFRVNNLDLAESDGKSILPFTDTQKKMLCLPPKRVTAV